MIKTHKQWMIETIESCKTRGRIQAASSAERLLEKFAGRVDETYGALSEEIANAVPSTDQAHQQLVTDAEGVAKWEERPYYRTTKRVHPNDEFGENLLPCTVIAKESNGFVFAKSEQIALAMDIAIGSEKVEVWFDGKQYLCEPKIDSYNTRYIGADAPPSTDDPFDFNEYPFCIMLPGNVYTETAGEHTIDFYCYMEKTVSNYGNVLQAYVNDDSMPMVEVERIKAAYANNIPIVVHGKSVLGLGISMFVESVTNDFITISGHATNNGRCLLGSAMYRTRDGSLYDQSSFCAGSYKENGIYYPVFEIAGKKYKIDVDSSGNLTATKLT